MVLLEPISEKGVIIWIIYNLNKLHIIAIELNNKKYKLSKLVVPKYI